jgi:zinc transport system substrate-binding protein
MYKLILISLFSNVYLFCSVHAIVSILPQQTFVQAIGGDKVDVSLMVSMGSSPHTYEPKPSQMMAISKADLYFAMDVEFEHVWLPKFESLNPSMKVISLTQGIQKVSMSHAHHGQKDGDKEEMGKDPHIWTAPSNVAIIAQNIYQALALEDAPNKAYYKKNLDLFLASIHQTDTRIKKILSSLKENRTFMVFHPSWGYFAKAYDLTQIAVEVEGKSPKPKELVMLIKEAKEEKITAIFTQAEFSDTSAKILAHELHIPVIKVSPLAPNWSENLINIAKAIAGEP